MDLVGVTTIRTPRDRAEIALASGDRVIGGGTWLYSEPQSGFDTIVDLTSLGWPEVEETDAALTLAATCRLATVHGLRSREWAAAPLFGQAVEALLASFKVWNVGTIGGNLCFGVPASAMVSLTTALDAELLLWGADGDRTVLAADFVRGPRDLDLAPDEVLRSIRFPRAALDGRTAFRKIALSDLGRSGAVSIARLGPSTGSGSSGASSGDESEFVLSVTAATARPWVFRWPGVPGDAELTAALDGVDDWYSDAHGAADWREAMTRRFAVELRDELGAGS
ncbi:FAD binding domain-containing protein [Galbitalea sp. SE-J8]|uniref:FAD binding domain-containing protein n=1 Tax=Galbitalea sp. SE-J8 TaxID=3054952 RepID=UPI00259D218D|nr:FAD binding domain-containing protein [Galbitalea sp. SE-J8]MDM4762135.1 FAD binding domain-containing protein [Galbitalea sp. SE-J8]